MRKPVKRKFKTVKVRDSWGKLREVQVPLPIAEYRDRKLGAKVSTYPPGFAVGARPQRNLNVGG